MGVQEMWGTATQLCSCIANSEGAIASAVVSVDTLVALVDGAGGTPNTDDEVASTCKSTVLLGSSAGVA